MMKGKVRVLRPILHVILNPPCNIPVPATKRQKTTGQQSPSTTGQWPPSTTGQQPFNSSSSAKRKRPGAEPQPNPPRPALLIDLTIYDDSMGDQVVQPARKRVSRCLPV
jgi:hypothetical protein